MGNLGSNSEIKPYCIMSPSVSALYEAYKKTSMITFQSCFLTQEIHITNCCKQKSIPRSTYLLLILYLVKAATNLQRFTTTMSALNWAPSTLTFYYVISFNSNMYIDKYGERHSLVIQTEKKYMSDVTNATV